MTVIWHIISLALRPIMMLVLIMSGNGYFINFILELDDGQYRK